MKNKYDENITYNGPTCPRCVNNKYNATMIGKSWYKKCIECGRTSSIKEDELTPMEPQ